ncbi:universal stress protein [Halorussus gelatinilyticus]|uniref:Universal stress protein n=1 Tax=Halorussus gelatinilyticus TaxID=2937524 RepID=A0A8U0IDU6_9EURY|nr:universal stress protein [Halorussus gelatinilyticus]UPV98870.1 universal stress protein [Halorussus gelatinilyticus]
MFEQILVPVDGSDGSDAAVGHAADVADRFDAAVHVLFVASTNRDSVTVVGSDVVDALESEGAAVVDSAEEDLRERGVACESEVVQGDPATTIADYADSRGMDLAVMATRGRTGLSRYLLGSVTEKVVRLSDVPVLTVRTHDDARTSFPYENVLAPTDGSRVANAAADRAVDLAAALDATLHAVSVVDDTSLGFDVRSAAAADELREAAEDAIAEVTASADDAGVEQVREEVLRGSVHRAILDYVDEEDVDVIVVGTRGRGGTDRILLGSVTERLVRTSPVPVLTVRR